MRRTRRRSRTSASENPSTTTLVEHQARASEQVLYLRTLPSGPTYPLSDYLDSRDRIQWIGIGRDAYCDIMLEDEHVSSYHCLLRRTEQALCVEDRGSKNLTLLNGVPVEGSARILPGMLLTVGRTTLLACGERGDAEQPHITAPDVDSYLREASWLYGSITKAAQALRIATTTMAQWLRTGRFQSRKGPR